MQQVPKHEQGLFLQMAATMGRAYCLHTPLALPTALQRGAATVDHPYQAGPFYLLMPMNTQAAWLPGFNLDELPEVRPLFLGAAEGDYGLAAEVDPERRNGSWSRSAAADGLPAPNWQTLLERSGGVLVHTPIATGCIPYNHPQNMTVGGSKGSLPGNYAMENADLLIAIGTRAVCQSDCSRTGYPNVRRVINLNADIDDATHYNHTLALVGDVRRTLAKLNLALGPAGQRQSRMVGSLCRQENRVAGLQSRAGTPPHLAGRVLGRTRPHAARRDQNCHRLGQG